MRVDGGDSSTPARFGAAPQAGRPRRRRRQAAAERPPAPPEVLKSWFPIPDRYGDPNKSDLTADVKPGQPLDIDLK